MHAVNDSMRFFVICVACCAALVLRAGADSAVAYVDANAPAGNQPPFDSPERASRSIVDAIATLSPGGKVVFAPNQRWTLESSFSAIGDFSLVGPDDLSTTIVGGNVSVNAGQRFENLIFSNNVVTVKAGGVLSNCAVRCGTGERSDGRALKVCGGLATDTTVEDFKGVGVLMDRNAESTLERCVVRGGQTPDDGNQYAIVSVLPEARAVLRNCVVAGNVTRCVAHGGTLGYLYTTGCGYSLNYKYTLVLDRCIVSNNQGRVAVMRLCNSGNVNLQLADSPRVYATNCLFAANKSIQVGESGSANRLFMCRGEFVNCTIAENETAAQVELFNLMNEGTGCPQNAAVAKFVNTIVSGNACMATYLPQYGDINARSCIFPEAVAGNYSAAGNLAGPAVFRGKGVAPHALKTRSPGCGAGDASIWSKGDFDLVGRPRLNRDGTVDMGCYASRRRLGPLFILQ